MLAKGSPSHRLASLAVALPLLPVCGPTEATRMSTLQGSSRATARTKPVHSRCDDWGYCSHYQQCNTAMAASRPHSYASNGAMTRGHDRAGHREQSSCMLPCHVDTGESNEIRISSRSCSRACSSDRIRKCRRDIADRLSDIRESLEMRWRFMRR